MNRFAVFVDAGYLYAEGGKLCCDTASRDQFTVNAGALTIMLRCEARKRCGLGYLRTYWYDGARNGVKTATHHAIAALPNVKLRLGRVNSRGQQKGVDALIYRDLMTLAHERAIGDAFLLSGDEDLREGVIAAQDRGVRVTLFGIDPGYGNRNQSQELLDEADEFVVLKRSDISGYFFKTTKSKQPELARDDLSSVGREFAHHWLQNANDDEIGIVLRGYPKIPHEIDVELTRAVAGSLQDDEEARRHLRRSFWEAFRQASGAGLQQPAQTDSAVR